MPFRLDKKPAGVFEGLEKGGEPVAVEGLFFSVRGGMPGDGAEGAFADVLKVETGRKDDCFGKVGFCNGREILISAKGVPESGDGVSVSSGFGFFREGGGVEGLAFEVDFIGILSFESSGEREDQGEVTSMQQNE